MDEAPLITCDDRGAGAVASSAQRTGMLCATSSEQAGIAPQNRRAYCKTYTKDRKETEVHLRIGRSQTAFSPNIEEMLEDVKHARARQKAGQR